MKKPRFDSLLFRLPAAQQAQVYRWLHEIGYRETMQKLALPPPDGFNLKTHLASLRRFFVRYSDLHREREMLEDIRSMDPKEAEAALDHATHMAAFDLALGACDLKKFSVLSRWVSSEKDRELKARSQELFQDQLALHLEKIEFDRASFELSAISAALRNSERIREISNDSTLDSSAKIRAARRLLFGKAP